MSELDDIKEGDTVAQRGDLSGWRIVKVTRTTPTQIIIGHHRFRRRDGRGVGENQTWGRGAYICLPTPEIIQQARRAKNISLISRCNFKKLDDDTLAKIGALVKAAEHPHESEGTQ